MLNPRRILWGEGMFLRPQHFQQFGLHAELHCAETIAMLRRNAWGVRQLAIDEPALQGGLLRVDTLALRFRDGTLYDAPRRDPLPASRNLNDLPQSGETMNIHACLPDLMAHGGNFQRDENSSARPVRYRHTASAIADLYTDALEADVSGLQLNIGLMTDHENRDGHESIPIARVRRDAQGMWQLDGDFLPPLLSCSANAGLLGRLRRLTDILRVKAEMLASTRRERTRDVSEFGTSDIGAFWLLHTVNRHHSRLDHLLHADPVHAEELHASLAELRAELTTFSNRYALDDLPRYRHADPASSLTALDHQIRDLLDTVISARHVVIPLTSTKPSFHVGHLESDRLLDNADFYLSVRSDLPTAPLIEAVPSKLKVGAPDDVEKILNSALHGVSLMHAPQTPSTLPVRAGNHYFALEPHGAIFKRMLQARSVCIYVPQPLAGISLELIAVFR